MEIRGAPWGEIGGARSGRLPSLGAIPHVCPQVVDDLHTDCTSQSLLNLSLHSRALSPPTSMKKPLYLPPGHHHCFPSQFYALCERGACYHPCLVPCKISPIFTGVLGQSCAGAGHICLAGEAPGAAVGHTEGGMNGTGLTSSAHGLQMLWYGRKSVAKLLAGVKAF